MWLVGAFAQSRNSTTSILALGFCPETEPREGRGKDFDVILKVDCNSYFSGSLTSGLSFFHRGRGFWAGGQGTRGPACQEERKKGPGKITCVSVLAFI